ncbi:MAG: response regulator [Acidobacteria bacterium]|nr:MAG: response regulator [Acidobacteriota bacterium]
MEMRAIHGLTIERAPRRVMVLCQDVDAARTIEAILHKEDYQTTLIRNPHRAALMITNRNDTDVIIGDAQMCMGRERENILRSMRLDLEGFSVPLLLLIDPDDDQQWHLIDRLASDEFVLKPFREEELLCRLKGLLWRRDLGLGLMNDDQCQMRCQAFAHYVRTDLETRREAGEASSLGLIEVVGAWDHVMRGDEVGDQWTEQLMTYMTTNLRRIDRVVRSGRVTLMVYMPNRSGPLASEALRFLQAEFAQRTGLPFCAGLATYPEDGESFSELVLAADHLLMKARGAREQLVLTSQDAVRERDGGHKIVIVDGDRFITTPLKAVFDAWGYRTMIAENVHQAMEIMRREPPHLLILDQRMPELTGFQFLEQWRAQRDGQWPVPVIMLTTMITPNDILHGFELGVTEYVGKPFNPRELIVRVERVLADRPSFRRVPT